MEIKVLGAGCSKCKATYTAIDKVVKENGLEVTLTKVEDIMELLDYNIMTTPAVVVDGTVRIKGYIPSESEIKRMLGI
ncbi:MAG: TM0996/MTH895 family glutaredoxin-like protein [Alistipes sp.]|nr:TM0996/MTH895 family glutaredoxin-like protein [Alistipes sp.]